MKPQNRKTVKSGDLSKHPKSHIWYNLNTMKVLVAASSRVLKIDFWSPEWIDSIDRIMKFRQTKRAHYMQGKMYFFSPTTLCCISSLCTWSNSAATNVGAVLKSSRLCFLLHWRSVFLLHWRSVFLCTRNVKYCCKPSWTLRRLTVEDSLWNLNVLLLFLCFGQFPPQLTLFEKIAKYCPQGSGTLRQQLLAPQVL